MKYKHLVRQFKCTKRYKLKLLLVFTILTSQCYSHNLNKEKFDEMAKIFGYHYGQSRSIELITNKFPGLSRDFLIAEIECNKKYKPSVTRVETELSENFGKEWSGIKNSFMSQFDEIINKDISYDESLEFLSEMRERSKGVMESSILQLLLLKTKQNEKNNLNNIISTRNTRSECTIYSHGQT